MENDGALDTLCEVMETDRAFFAMVRYLDTTTRSALVAQHMRNTNNAMAVIRETIVARRAQTAATAQGDRVVMTFPLAMLLDPSGNMMNPDLPANFMEPVPVVPTRAQIDRAVDSHIHTEGTCSICQDTLTCAMQIRACGHMFHAACLEEWFTMNSRCPMCRHDIRDAPTHLRTSTRDRDSEDDEDDRVHTDEESELDL